MEVRVEPLRGHITLHRGGAAVVTLVDVGPVLNLWQYESGVEIDSETARELGAALIAWADQKSERAVA